MDFLELARMKIKEIETARKSQNETIDYFWLENIVPRLSKLSKAGRLPDLAICPRWQSIDRLWRTQNPDVSSVKKSMEEALTHYEMIL